MEGIKIMSKEFTYNDFLEQNLKYCDYLDKTVDNYMMNCTKGIDEFTEETRAYIGGFIANLEARKNMVEMALDIMKSMDEE